MAIDSLGQGRQIICWDQVTFVQHLDHRFGFVIDKAEFRRAIVSLGYSGARREIDELFDVLDADGNGTVDYRELVLVIDPSRGETRQTGEQTDTIIIKELSGEAARIAASRSMSDKRKSETILKGIELDLDQDILQQLVSRTTSMGASLSLSLPMCTHLDQD